jgi:hypothetical protein
MPGQAREPRGKPHLFNENGLSLDPLESITNQDKLSFHVSDGGVTSFGD